MLLEPSHHIITLVEAYVDNYGPAVNDLTSLWTINVFLELMDLSATPLQIDGPPLHFNYFLFYVSITYALLLPCVFTFKLL
jgi:hypothetical protein